MNAPWSPSRSGGSNRDPFAAFVCDDNAADLIRPVVVEMGWPVEKVHKGGLRNAVQTLSVAASPNILFVDLSESGDPLNDINALAEVCEPGTVVIAAGQVNDVRLYRDLLASGIQDYLLKPFSPDQLRDALSHAQAVLHAPKAGEGAVERPHLMTAVIGARGGSGASTIATSVAWLLADKERRSTSLLDLDLHFGTGALTLDLEPGRGLTDAIENPSRIDGLFIERAMVKASEKLAILSAEAPIHQPTLTDGTAYHLLQEEMKTAFECTVIDLPRNVLVQYPHLMAEVHCSVVVAELTLASARDVIRILSWLKSNAPQSQVVVALNKVVAGATPEITKKDFEASIERKIDVVIPYDLKITSQAAKLGKPVADAGKGSKIAGALQEVVTKVLSTAGQVDDVAPRAGKAPASAKPSLMAKISDLKALLPTRAAKQADTAPAA